MRGQGFSLAPPVREIGDRNRPGAECCDQKSHALPLRHAQQEEQIAQQQECPDTARDSLAEQCRQEQQEDRSELVREAIKAIGLDRKWHDGKEQAQQPRRQGSFRRAEDLVQARPAEDVPEEGKHRVASMHVRPQVPTTAHRD